MFGFKARRIENLEDELEKVKTQLQLEFQNSNALVAKFQGAEKGRVEAIAQVENLREQLQRTLEAQSKARGQWDEELMKGKEQLANVQEELRNAYQEAQRRAGQAARSASANSEDSGTEFVDAETRWKAPE